MLSRDEQLALLRHARETIDARLRTGAAPGPVRLAEPYAHSGAFVTLEVDHDLRGCIGYPGSEQRLDEVIAECAIAAASDDPRFPPIEARELDRLDVEISVLTPIEPVQDLQDIQVGRDGLVVQEGRRRGLLLPQVATERGWDRDTFLSHTCLKAGLRADAWRRGATVLRFQAEVFSERDFADRR